MSEGVRGRGPSLLAVLCSVSNVSGRLENVNIDWECVSQTFGHHMSMRKFLTFLILLLSITGQPSEEWVIYGPLTFLRRRFCHHSWSWSLWHKVTHAREPRSGPIVKPELDPFFGLSSLHQEFYWLNINYLFKKEDSLEKFWNILPW